jgi:hypothetical protein
LGDFLRLRRVDDDPFHEPEHAGCRVVVKESEGVFVSFPGEDEEVVSGTVDVRFRCGGDTHGASLLL